MLQPIATPLCGPSGSPDRLAGIVMRLEDDAAPQLTLTTLAVRQTGGVRSLVVCHLGDGAREPVSASDARVLAILIRDALGRRSQLDAWADSLEEAADAADRQAAAILQGMAERDSWEVTQPRGFREGR